MPMKLCKVTHDMPLDQLSVSTQHLCHIKKSFFALCLFETSGNSPVCPLVLGALVAPGEPLAQWRFFIYERLCRHNWPPGTHGSSVPLSQSFAHQVLSRARVEFGLSCPFFFQFLFIQNSTLCLPLAL